MGHRGAHSAGEGPGGRVDRAGGGPRRRNTGRRGWSTERHRSARGRWGPGGGSPSAPSPGARAEGVGRTKKRCVSICHAYKHEWGYTIGSKMAMKRMRSSNGRRRRRRAVVVECGRRRIVERRVEKFVGWKNGIDHGERITGRHLHALDLLVREPEVLARAPQYCRTTCQIGKRGIASVWGLYFRNSNIIT